jgi:hypothetical protein
MEKAVVLISVSDFVNGRKIANEIQDQNFAGPNSLREFVKSQEKDAKNGMVQIYSLDSFMEASNDQDINLEEFWVSYVNLKLF